MIPMILLAMLNIPYTNTVEFIDSKDDPAITYLIVNGECKVKLKKTELRDWDLVVKKAEKQCDMKLSL